VLKKIRRSACTRTVHNTVPITVHISDIILSRLTKKTEDYLDCRQHQKLTYMSNPKPKAIIVIARRHASAVLL